ncbi:MAG: hypothetical protein ABIM99_06470 [Candidatus Dojkabacteria bacterium]
MNTLDFLDEPKTPGTGYSAMVTTAFYNYMEQLRKISELRKANPKMTDEDIAKLIRELSEQAE